MWEMEWMNEYSENGMNSNISETCISTGLILCRNTAIRKNMAGIIGKSRLLAFIPVPNKKKLM